MNIPISEEELKRMVNESVNAKIDELVESEIKARVHKILFDRLDGIFSEWKSMDVLVERIVRENIEKQIPTLQGDYLEKACAEIAKNLEWRLSESITSAVSYGLRPVIENEEE